MQLELVLLILEILIGKKFFQERQQVNAKNRYAEAIVQSYFDELAVSDLIIIIIESFNIV